MPWLQVDDGEGDAPWVWDIGNEAYGVYVRLGTYCAKHLTDGLVPWGVALSYAGGKKSLLVLEHAARIDFRGHDREKPSAVFLPDYLQSNRSRAKVEADKEAKSEKARRAANKRWASNGVRA